MNYLSLFSGIEAASVAWQPLGFAPVAFAEIDKFCARLLAHHYPDVANHGDVAQFAKWPDHDIDILVGGSPCQGFSVAGFRLGLGDPRSNLALAYAAIAARYRPRWLLWENVPGVLSTNSGRDFGALLGALEGIGYGLAWRVLDAQYVRVDGFGRAVPQRRRRVFVVGHLGDWRRAAAVLIERAGLQGHPAPRRQAGQGIAPTLAARTRGGGGHGTDFDVDGGLIPAVANPLTARMVKGVNTTMDEGVTMVAHALRGEGFDASEAEQTPAVCYDMRGRGGGGMMEGPHQAANIRSGSGGSSRSYVAHGWRVRRLTPVECERLQSFPDNYTLIEGASDSARYHALGNSMAVNVMRWIGRRIQFVEQLASVRLAA